ncbi:MAG: tRNA pseudouridine(55) synthase TruB [Spirochaetes bacterium]|uniref:tRNA pseudouridine synthase B n=1 Tax=Candidatus Aphodenecus pullistercoris TaxID=2840669 RepID=A0A9D9E784_9SPIR|nr:tRNA pseudouridine(55) synthase TruB [Candidatus Aphodenecus pullistercoris]
MSTFSVTVMKKEGGITSYRALSPLKQAVKGSKVGHTGTLDQFASGIMVALTGEATRLNPLFTACDKRYRAALSFGAETDTLDPEGQVVASGGRIPKREEVEAVLPSFIGPCLQVPPVYSAIHIGGKRAYQEARKGNDVVLEPRPVTIHSLSLVDYRDGVAIIDAHVGKGTYIRSLGRDIARALGTYGHLEALERYKVGPFGYSDVHGLPATAEESEENLRKLISTVVEVEYGALRRIANGYLPQGALSLSGPEGHWAMLYCRGRFIGVLEQRQEGGWRIAALASREDL